MGENKKTEEILNLKKRYKYTCPYCSDTEHNAGPSLFMSGMQLNWGSGTCPECKKSFSLMIDSENKRMISFIIENVDKMSATRLPDACYKTIELD